MTRQLARLTTISLLALVTACAKPETPLQGLLTDSVHIVNVTVTGDAPQSKAMAATLATRLRQEFATAPLGPRPAQFVISIESYTKGNGKVGTDAQVGGELVGRVLLTDYQNGGVLARGTLDVTRAAVNGTPVDPRPGLPDDVLADNFARAARGIFFGFQPAPTEGVAPRP